MKLTTLIPTVLLACAPIIESRALNFGCALPGNASESCFHDDFAQAPGTQLGPRAAHGAQWTKYAPKGAQYYADWQKKTGDDVVYACDFDTQFNLQGLVKKVLPAPGIRATLQGAGFGVDRDYYAIVMDGPKDAPKADFANTISASQGVVLANAINRGALPSDPTSPNFDPAFPQGRDPVPWQFSTVTWWMWKKTLLTENPTWVQNPSQADYSGIKSFWHREIDNQDTLAILNEAFAGKDTNEVQTWTPDDTDQDTNAFWALLGSPNGNSMQYLLTDNKVAVKGKGIKSLNAKILASGYYTMWAMYE